MNTSSFVFLRTLTAGMILGGLGIISSVCSAGAATTPPQEVVKFADLNISTPQGAEALYRRIHSAAGNVCRRMYDTKEAYNWNWHACFQKLIRETVTKVNEPALSAVFASKYRISTPIAVAAADVR